MFSLICGNKRVNKEPTEWKKILAVHLEYKKSSKIKHINTTEVM